MRKAEITMQGVPAGILEEIEPGRVYRFRYHARYNGPPISLTLPVEQKVFEFDRFPPFFDGLLPEGIMLESLLKKLKIDRYGYFGQLVTVGGDLVGATTATEISE